MYTQMVNMSFIVAADQSLDNNKEKYQYDYEDIMQMLMDNGKLTNVQDTIKIFWEIFVMDALLGNFDRHGGNWGFLKKDNKYVIAPIFDNGSCLFPQMTNEKTMLEIMNSVEETDNRIYKFPTSQIKLNGKKSSYYEIINSLYFKECNQALKKIYKLFDQQKINQIIDTTPFITNTHKEFYKYMISERFNKIIKASYIKLMENENE